MAADCAIEMRRHHVAMVSLWPGAVQTDKAMKMVEEKSMHARIPNGKKVSGSS